MKLISLKKDENIKVALDIKSFLNPDYVYIPSFSKKIIVKQNAKVVKGDLLFNNSNEKSPISGEVIGLKKMQASGKYTDCVVIKNDYQEQSHNLKSPNISKITIDILLNALENHHDKELFQVFKSLKKAQNIVLKVFDEEPYTKNSIMLFKENLNEILDMVDALQILYHSNKNIIVVKGKESSIINECLNTIGSYPTLKLSLIDDLYFMNTNKYLLDYLHLNEYETLTLSVYDVVKIYKYIYHKEDEYEKTITISGNGIKGNGLVLRVKKYTSLNEILTKYVKANKDSLYIENGLLTGFLINKDDAIISDNTKVINIMKESKYKESTCFNCGKCLSICPVNINPIKCYKQKEKDKRCINCGLCNYICPVYLDLKKYVRGEK